MILEHVKMRGARKRLFGGAHGMQRGLDQGPRAPAALDPLFRENDVRVVLQGFADHLELGLVGARIKMDRQIIARRRQALRLTDDGLRVFVAQQDIGDFGHFAGMVPSLSTIRLY